MPESYPKMLGKKSTWKNENSLQVCFSCQRCFFLRCDVFETSGSCLMNAMP